MPFSTIHGRTSPRRASFALSMRRSSATTATPCTMTTTAFCANRDAPGRMPSPSPWHRSISPSRARSRGPSPPALSPRTTFSSSASRRRAAVSFRPMPTTALTVQMTRSFSPMRCGAIASTPIPRLWAARFPSIATHSRSSASPRRTSRASSAVSPRQPGFHSPVCATSPPILHPIRCSSAATGCRSPFAFVPE